MAEKYYAGKNGKVDLTVGTATVEIAVKNWKCSHTIQELDITSTTSGGKYEVQGGIEKCEGTFEADWDIDAGPFDDGLSIHAGDYLSNLKLHVDNVSGAPKFQFASCFVKSVEVDMPIDGVVKYTVSFTSDGNFTLPA